MKLAKTAALAKVVLLGLVICCLAVQAICDGLQNQSSRHHWYQRTTERATQSRPGGKQELTAQLTDLYTAVKAFIHHRNAGNTVAAKADAELAKSLWANLPRPVQERLEMKHPSSAEMLEDLYAQAPAAKPTSKPASMPVIAAGTGTDPQPACEAKPATIPATMPAKSQIISVLGISLDDGSQAPAK